MNIIIKKSILAGILIGLGVIINLQSENPTIGDYKTAFNLGKQQETEMRFKHSTLLRGYV